MSAVLVRYLKRERSAARLAAVQGLYQIEFTGRSPETVLAEATRHRLVPMTEDEKYVEPDEALFRDIVGGVAEEREALSEIVAETLVEGWAIARLDPTLRALLLAGAYELRKHRDVPARVTIDEYVSLAHGFFSNVESGFVNGVLDRLAHRLRADEMSAADQLGPNPERSDG